MFKKKAKNKQIYVDLRHLDSDQDGLSDYDEINIYGTDPYDPDTDKDGISDGEDVGQGFNPGGRNRDTLRNLFIPNQQNKFQPFILRPPRLIFYTLVVLFIQLIIIGFVIFFPTGAWLTPDLMTAESKKIITLTNNLRQSLNITVLKESSLLNQAAYNKAQDMLINQYFAHIGPDNKDLTDWIQSSGYKYDVAGENLAMGFANAQEVVNGWIKSPTHYANLVDPDFRDIGVGMVSGPYQDYDTTLVAQYFAFSSEPSQLQTPTPQPNLVKPIKIAATADTNSASQFQTPTPQPKPANILVNKDTTALVTPKPQPKPVVVVNKPVVTTLAPIPTPVPVNPPAKPADILVTPRLISPADNFITGQNEVNLVIYAPKAEKIIVYSADKEIGSKDSIKSDFFDLKVNFTEAGKQILVIKAVKGSEAVFSKYYSVNIDKTPPTVDLNKSKLIIAQPTGQKDKIIKVVAYLSTDTKEASVVFNDYRINLSQEKDDLENISEWTGQLIIFSQDESAVFSVVTLPTLIAEDEFGNTVTVDLSWENVIPVKPSIIKQYLFLKSYPLKNVELLFDVTNWYYEFILVIAIISLLLNIFIEIRKQYPHIILSTLGFITLLIILILI